MKAVLRGKFIHANASTKKEQRSLTNNLYFQLKKPEKEEQTKLKESRKKEAIKIGMEIKEIESRKTAENQQNQKLVLKKDQQN